MGDYPRDTGKFYLIAHRANGQPGATALYVSRIYEDRDGNVRVRWTEHKHAAKVWATEAAAERNADNVPTWGRVQVTWR